MKTKEKKALIVGISGQDGAFLADLLVKKGYEVFGTSRDCSQDSLVRLTKLGLLEKITMLRMSPDIFSEVTEIIERTDPDEIYNLAGQSSVGLSFVQPSETINGITLSNTNILQSIKDIKPNIRYCLAGSGECFGDLGDVGAIESTPFFPRSPYAAAKASAMWTVRVYRESFGLFAATAIFYNHESFLRSTKFVTQKIVKKALQISKGDNGKLELGNIDVARDWGWAAEYMEAMYAIIRHEKPEDFIVATGRPISLCEFISAVFEKLDMDWKEHVILDESKKRPTDPKITYGNPEKIFRETGWKAIASGRDVAELMVVKQFNDD